MNAHRRDILLLVTLAAATATSALGQAAPSAAGATQSTQSAAIPDFSGIWAHPYLTGFEPPTSGPGPIRNRSRSRNGVSNFALLVGDYTNPILQPQAAEVVKEHGTLSLLSAERTQEVEGGVGNGRGGNARRPEGKQSRSQCPIRGEPTQRLFKRVCQFTEHCLHRRGNISWPSCREGG